jgi:hypothetical protein
MDGVEGGLLSLLRSSLLQVREGRGAGRGQYAARELADALVNGLQFKLACAAMMVVDGVDKLQLAVCVPTLEM